MGNSVLDSSAACAVDSRMPSHTDISAPPSLADRRIQCQQDILTLLGNVGGRIELAPILGVFHLHYRPHAKNRGKYLYTRADFASSFLRRMEDAGLLTCTYNADGIVLEAVLCSL